MCDRIIPNIRSFNLKGLYDHKHRKTLNKKLTNSSSRNSHFKNFRCIKKYTDPQMHEHSNSIVVLGVCFLVEFVSKPSAPPQVPLGRTPEHELLTEGRPTRVVGTGLLASLTSGGGPQDRTRGNHTQWYYWTNIAKHLWNISDLDIWNFLGMPAFVPKLLVILKKLKKHCSKSSKSSKSHCPCLFWKFQYHCPAHQGRRF